jgi:hypothetical protein
MSFIILSLSDSKFLERLQQSSLAAMSNYLVHFSPPVVGLITEELVFDSWQVQEILFSAISRLALPSSANIKNSGAVHPFLCMSLGMIIKERDIFTLQR